jgi:hypothetical protein
MFAVQTSLVQSESPWQDLPGTHLGHAPPPQSTSVSKPFSIASVHVAETGGLMGVDTGVGVAPVQSLPVKPGPHTQGSSFTHTNRTVPRGRCKVTVAARQGVSVKMREAMRSTIERAIMRTNSGAKPEQRIKTCLAIQGFKRRFLPLRKYCIVPKPLIQYII